MEKNRLEAFGYGVIAIIITMNVFGFFLQNMLPEVTPINSYKLYNVGH